MNLSVIIPSFHSEELTMVCVKSFLRFCTSNVNLGIIVVENSGDVSYRNAVLDLGDNIKWINNDKNVTGSEANASAIEVGLKEIDTEWVFLCHCDTCVASPLFFKEMTDKVEEGYKLIGTVKDPARIKAIHVSGYLTTTELAREVSECR
jgi:GT2 family glycosyltransferase